MTLPQVSLILCLIYAGGVTCKNCIYHTFYEQSSILQNPMNECGVGRVKDLYDLGIIKITVYNGFLLVKGCLL